MISVFSMIFTRLLMFALMLTTYLTSAFTAYSLVCFLSISEPVTNERPVIDHNWNMICWKLIIDLALLTFFLVAHSFLLELKDFAKRIHFESVFRSFYVLTTNAVLYTMFVKWQSADYVLWSLTNLLGNRTLLTLHFFCWFLLYGSVLVLDCNELLGVKQIYNKMLQLQNPISYKSRDLQDLYANFRHPGIAWLSLILFTYPVMTLDRLLIVSVLVPYTYTSWKITPANMQYLKKSFRTKNLY